MEEHQLHSSYLEKLSGKISCEIVLQKNNLRKVHLRDVKGTSRTMALVYFYPVKGAKMQQVHKTIVEGGMLGKSLSTSGVAFTKEYLGSFDVLLPAWLKKDFKTSKDRGLVLFSRIFVAPAPGTKGMQHYADILEIIPPELRRHFEDRAPSIDN